MTLLKMLAAEVQAQLTRRDPLELMLVTRLIEELQGYCGEVYGHPHQSSVDGKVCDGCGALVGES